MTTLLQCQQLVCRLGGQTVLDRLDLELGPGEALGLLGRSGSGKTTLLRAIAGLEPLQGGTIEVAGRVVTRGPSVEVPPHRRGVSMLFQDRALWPNLSVAENVKLGLSGQRLTRREVACRVDAMLTLCEVATLATRRPATLSGGQQQRAALARALAVHPRLLLLDEPFGGLDLLTKEAIAGRIAEWSRELGFALILVTHDASELQAMCDTIAVIDGGRVVERVDMATLFRQPQSDLGRAFVRAWRRESVPPRR